jgi:hypothetical protein
MDYFQGVVGEYLRVDRSCFVNSEFWIRGNLEAPHSKPHWFVDVVALHMGQKCAFLCEVTYAKKPTALLNRLQSWRQYWDTMILTFKQDASIPADWSVRPWIFAPKAVLDAYASSIRQLHPSARFTNMEDIMPWLYCTWDRKDEPLPPDVKHPAD